MASATLSGRELALKRRQAMALHGKTGVTKTAAAGRQPTAARSAPTAPAASPALAASSAPATSPAVRASDAALIAQAQANSSRQASRARREALSQSGKAALQPTAARPSGRVRPGRQAPAMTTQPAMASASEAQAAPASSCGCGCNGAPGGCGDARQSDAGLRAASETSAPMIVKASVQPTGRALAQARRAALAQDGKAGLKRVAQATKIAAAMPGQDWQAAIAKGATGRQVAMQRRLVQALTGRSGASEPARPSGRQRARNVVPAPAKVEEGHTLSGQSVTGTMVERSKRVTGNEPGSCRAITGTEYIGSEQFDSLCSKRPAPAPAKVGVSSTARERRVTGTEVGRSGKVTGDEPGACRGVTGTEYLAAERYEEFCNTRPAPSPAKVGVSDTAKGKAVTGTQVGHSGKVTGDEPGADRAITGTGYTLPAAGVDAPEKVAVTHTTHGKTVTGTAVGHTVKITGDEPGACRGITGTEYLAAEQFQALCNTAPLATPRKVSVMSTRGDQPVSGTGVGRSGSVTGDEPGACRTITGSQYYTASDFGGLCNASGPRKVGATQTLAGRTVTGTEVGSSPKLTGDEMGGCKPVTGIDYVGAQAACTGSTPVAPVAKVAVDQTWRGQPVTGSYVGRSTRVTGDESGGCSPISGTPYIGRSQYRSFCAAPDLSEQEARIRTSAIIPATAVTGDRPGAGGSVMTGDERGACEVVSGTPYVGADNTVSECATSGRFVSRPRTWVEPAQPPAPIDFSIASPARQAWERNYGDVTGTGYNSERITGPVNKANGLITGTPEFRHRDATAQQAEQETAIAAARRLTGEGSQVGSRVTGDAWHAQSRVTGTEGASSLARNMSMRGSPRGAGANAQAFREIERPDVPESRITGSSGNTGKGAVVTLSGGARG
ncbi:MAG: CsoS2 family carboxysome shell protein [Pseudomonadota bacterium]